MAATIGIAVVEHDGCYLVGTREGAIPLAGLAEFPGGKCRRGETTDACAARECREETGLEVEATELILQRRFDYGFGPIELFFWRAHPVRRETPAPDLRGFRWVPTEELGKLQFPEANEPVIAMLRERSDSS